MLRSVRVDRHGGQSSTRAGRALAQLGPPSRFIRNSDRPETRPHQPAPDRLAVAVTPAGVIRRPRDLHSTDRGRSMPADSQAAPAVARQRPVMPIRIAGFACMLLLAACQTFSSDGGMDVVAGVA